MKIIFDNSFQNFGKPKKLPYSYKVTFYFELSPNCSKHRDVNVRNRKLERFLTDFWILILFSKKVISYHQLYSEILL